jgi:thiosulfate reductase cytochrome b subunit
MDRHGRRDSCPGGDRVRTAPCRFAKGFETMKRIDLHPLPLRMWHWINALIVIILIVTGIYLRLYGIAALKPHDPVLFWHKCVGLAMIVTTVFWFIFTMPSKSLRRQYRIKISDLKGVIVQTQYYFFSIFVGGENPFKVSADAKYNPLQKIAYDAILFIFIPVQAVTGLLFMDIPVLRQYLLSENLMGLLGVIHVIFAYLFVLYLIVHLYMATLGDTIFSHTKAMIVGYEVQTHGIEEDEARLIPRGNEK